MKSIKKDIVVVGGGPGGLAVTMAAAGNYDPADINIEKLRTKLAEQKAILNV